MTLECLLVICNLYYIFYFLLEYMAFISFFFLQKLHLFAISGIYLKKNIPSLFLLIKPYMYHIHHLISYHDTNHYLHIPIWYQKIFKKHWTNLINLVGTACSWLNNISNHDFSQNENLEGVHFSMVTTLNFKLQNPKISLN